MDVHLPGRTAKEWMEEIRERAAAYVPEWRLDRENPDIGVALAEVYARLHSGIEQKYRMSMWPRIRWSWWRNARTRRIISASPLIRRREKQSAVFRSLGGRRKTGRSMCSASATRTCCRFAGAGGFPSLS